MGGASKCHSNKKLLYGLFHYSHKTLTDAVLMKSEVSAHYKTFWIFTSKLIKYLLFSAFLNLFLVRLCRWSYVVKISALNRCFKAEKLLTSHVMHFSQTDINICKPL